MRTTTLFALYVPSISATLYQYPSEFQFNELLQTHSRLFISFTSTALESLSSLNSIFTQAATDLSTPFVTIDCHIGKSLCRDYDVNSFPAFRLLERDLEDEQKITETRYRGARTVAGMRSFVKKREIPVLSKLEKKDMDFQHIDDIVFIAFLDPSDTNSLSAYQAVAQIYHFEFAFGYTTDISIASAERMQVPSLICYRNLDNDNSILNGPFTQQDIESFLKTAKKSVIKDFLEKDVEMFMQPDKLTLYIFTKSPIPKTFRHELTPLAKKLEKYVTVALVDVVRYPDMPANFGLKEMGGEQALIVHAPMNDQIFRYARGKKIESVLVEDMLMTILQGRAVSGQEFGQEAENLIVEEDAGAAADGQGEHDEL